MKVVLQDGNKDCGICSLLSIIRFYGGDVSKEYLREITNTTKNGVSALGLIEGAKMLGFDAVGVCGDLNKIEDNNLPCLAHILTNKGFKHFIVIYKIDRDKELIYVMDPAKGKRILSFMEFKIISTNNYIFLKCIKKLPLLKPRKIIRREIINYLKDHYKGICEKDIFKKNSTIEKYKFNTVSSYILANAGKEFSAENVVSYYNANNSKPWIFVLVGLPSSGKSTIAEVMAQKGFSAIDGDCALQTAKHRKNGEKVDYRELFF